MFIDQNLTLEATQNANFGDDSLKKAYFMGLMNKKLDKETKILLYKSLIQPYIYSL